MKKILIVSTALCSLVLAGCAEHKAASENFDKVGNTVDAGLNRLGDRKTVRSGGSQFSDSIFVGASPERNNAALLPSRLQASGAVRLESRDALTLDEIAQRLAEITGIPHVLALGPTGQISSATDSIMTAADVNATNTVPGTNGAIPPVTGSPEAQAAARVTSPSAAPQPPRATPVLPIGRAQERGTGVTMRPNLRGSLSEVLDQVANGFDVEWSYSDGRVMFRDYVTRKYQISALPGTSGGSASIGANSITSESSLRSDVWGEIDAALKSMLGEGATVSLGSTTGMITVTAKVSDQNRVEEYVQQMNGVIGQQVSFDVNTFTVSLSDENATGVELTTALKGNDGSVDYTGSVDGSDAVGTINIGVMRGDVSVSTLIHALSSQGKVSVSTRAGATTSNNRMVPINQIQTKAYLKEVSVTQDENGNDLVERTPGEVETGFQMQLFPRVMNNREIMVQFTVRLSELNDLVTFGEGNDAIQLPEVSTTSFDQQAVLENGQTLILAGFERDRITIDDRKAAKGLLGGGGRQSSKTERVATVMMITPRIISRK
ncbi:hypothetical protein ACEUZ9_004700 [Paracoccus litorisediminis]|uniref:hypothetical protein n=1 Tax=Paracoccus litorisediminis TaxID=2006130 RepID=UPI003731542A